jgi:uncharacterized protein (DUF2336 family)
MLVRKFMLWVGQVSAAERAEGAGALARAYLYADFSEGEKREAEVALFSLLDDPSPIVRKSIAEAFASASDAPHAIVLALANDQSAISSPVLGRSPLLSDAELIDCAAIGDSFAQAAIALRPRLSMSVSAALAEVGWREALIALAVNPGADIADFSLRRMIERFGSDGEVREALLSRPNMPPVLRSALVARHSRRPRKRQHHDLGRDRARLRPCRRVRTRRLLTPIGTAHGRPHPALASLRPHALVRSRALRIVGNAAAARCRSHPDFPRRRFCGALRSSRTPGRLAAGFSRRLGSAARIRLCQRELPYGASVAHDHRTRAHRLRTHE